MKKGAQMSVPQRDICGSEVRQHLVNKAWVDDLERGHITCLQDVGHQLQRPQVITGQGSGGRAQLVEHAESGVGAAGNLTAEVLLAQLLGCRQETQVNLNLVLMNRFQETNIWYICIFAITSPHWGGTVYWQPPEMILHSLQHDCW